MTELAPRSIDQHRRFFGVIAALFDQWPESHRFQPDNPTHLRAWLLVKAGHCTINTYYIEGDASEAASLIQVIAASMFRRYAWARAKGNELRVCVPESINWRAVKHEEFCKINGAVDEIIKAETGLDPDQLLREREQAA